jgi:hypothetical protein
VGNAGEALDFIGNVFATANEFSIVAKEPDGPFLLVSNDVTEKVRLKVTNYELTVRGECGRTTVVSKLFGHTPKQQLGRPLEFLVPDRFSNRHSEHPDSCFTESRERPMRACFTTSAPRARMATSCRRSASVLSKLRRGSSSAVRSGRSPSTNGSRKS